MTCNRVTMSKSTKLSKAKQYALLLFHWTRRRDEREKLLVQKCDERPRGIVREERMRDEGKWKGMEKEAGRAGGERIGRSVWREGVRGKSEKKNG